MFIGHHTTLRNSHRSIRIQVEQLHLIIIYELRPDLSFKELSKVIREKFVPK